MSLRSKLVAGLVALALAVPAGIAIARNVHVNLGFDVQADPLGYVDVVDQGRPNAAVPTELVKRLGKATGKPWDVRLLQDWDTQLSNESYDDNGRGRAELSRSVTVPEPAAHVIGVATNTTGPDAAKDGSLYVVWFNTPGDAETWLTKDHAIFKDAAVEKRRESYWAGSFAVYYSPPASGADWSDEVLAALRELARA